MRKIILVRHASRGIKEDKKDSKFYSDYYKETLKFRANNCYLENANIYCLSKYVKKLVKKIENNENLRIIYDTNTERTFSTGLSIYSNCKNQKIFESNGTDFKNFSSDKDKKFVDEIIEFMKCILSENLIKNIIQDLEINYDLWLFNLDQLANRILSSLFENKLPREINSDHRKLLYYSSKLLQCHYRFWNKNNIFNLIKYFDNCYTKVLCGHDDNIHVILKAFNINIDNNIYYQNYINFLGCLFIEQDKEIVKIYYRDFFVEKLTTKIIEISLKKYLETIEKHLTI